jgi:hypothetical protein
MVGATGPVAVETTGGGADVTAADARAPAPATVLVTARRTEPTCPAAGGPVPERPLDPADAAGVPPDDPVTLPGVTAGALPGVTAGALPGVSAGALPGVTAGALPGVTAGALPGVTAGALPEDAAEGDWVAPDTADVAVGVSACRVEPACPIADDVVPEPA